MAEFSHVLYVAARASVVCDYDKQPYLSAKYPVHTTRASDRRSSRCMIK